MTDCQRTRAELPAYVDEVLSPELRTALARHLQECPGCRQEEVAQRGAATILRQRAHSLKD